MQVLILFAGRLSKGLGMIAKVVLTFSILLTVADVTLRSFRRPIFGTYELVALSSAIIFGFPSFHLMDEEPYRSRLSHSKTPRRQEKSSMLF